MDNDDVNNPIADIVPRNSTHQQKLNLLRQELFTHHRSSVTGSFFTQPSAMMSQKLLVIAYAVSLQLKPTKSNSLKSRYPENHLSLGIFSWFRDKWFYHMSSICTDCFGLDWVGFASNYWKWFPLLSLIYFASLNQSGAILWCQISAAAIYRTQMYFDKFRLLPPLGLNIFCTALFTLISKNCL